MYRKESRMKQTIKVADKPTADEIKATVEGNASKLDGITTYLESGGGETVRKLKWCEIFSH